MRSDKGKNVERITVDPNIMVGKPVIKCTRIPVYVILEIFESGNSIEYILDTYPDIDEDDVKSALNYASDILKREEAHVRSAV